MESSTSKAEVMKPLFLKAGVPLVLSVAGFVYARIVMRRSGVIAQASSMETKVNLNSVETIDSNQSHEELGDEEATFYSLDSTCAPLKDNDYDDNDEEKMITGSQFLCSIKTSDSESKVKVEEEMLGLKSRIQELKKRELELEKQFLCYQVMKEQESLIFELKNKLVLETVHVEFLDREISSMEAQNQRFEKLVVDCLRVLEQLEFVKQENELLGRTVKKLVRKTKENSRIIAEKNVKIEASEAEILRSCDELDTRNVAIMKLNDEIRELHTIVNQLQDEKNELLIKLKSSENSTSSISKAEAEIITVESYKKLVNELEQLQKDRANETAEIIYLRWTNACLRHELMRSHEQQQLPEEKKSHLELQLEGSVEIRDYGLNHQKQHGSIVGHGQQRDTILGVATNSQASPKSKKLIQKLKKWVEGGDNLKSKLDDKEKHENKCFRRLSVSEDAEGDHLIYGRKSTSSV